MPAPAPRRSAAPAPVARRAAAAPEPRRAVAPTPRGPAPRGRAPEPRAEVVRTNYTGEDGLRHAREVEERNQAEREARKDIPREPFRYFTPPGTTGDLIIVDEAPRFFRNEHALFNPKTNRYDLFVPCIKEHALCPACDVSDKQPYFAMYLTVIDLVGYENRQREWVDFSKKMLVIKPMQAKKFIRLYDRNNSLRGMRLEMFRDRKEDAVHGEPEMTEFVPEEDLLNYVTSYIDQDKQEIIVDCSEPFDYEAIYPELTERSLRALVGGSPPPGSREDDDRQLGRQPASRTGARARSDDAWSDDAPQRSARPAPRGRPAPEAEDAEYREVAPARRPAPAPSRQAPARPAPRGRAEPVYEGEGEDGPPWDENDLPDQGADVAPQRVPARRPAPAPVAAPRRPAPAAPQRPAPRGRVQEPEGDGYSEEDRTPPARDAGGIAARRAALRRPTR